MLTQAAHKKLCGKFGIQGYPTLKYFYGPKDAQPAEYDSKRDLASLQNFVKDKSGARSKVKKEAPSAVVTLTDDSVRPPS